MTTDNAYSLLTDEIISARDMIGEIDNMTLPEIFEQLRRDNITSFESLQPHQQQPWYSFLVQLASMALARYGDGSFPTSADGWSQLLLEMTDGNSHAWQLVVEDISQPAFMQPPVPEGHLEEAGYKPDIESPDGLDMLITSKNHDVKKRRILRPQPEHWLYALLTLQTMEGFLGRGNYGIVRMNGGFGNRPLVGLAADLSWGSRFNRDVDVLLDYRKELSSQYDTNGYSLLWLEPWDGAKASGIPLSDCDPYFIEICRRIRFSETNNTFKCWRANTKGTRIAAPEDLNGRTQDPWTPINKEEAKALTLGGAGFTYQLLQEILLGSEYQRPITLEFKRQEQEGAYLIAQALVRGQGKTEGLHRRIIPVPPRVSGRLGKPSEREKLAKRAGQRVAKTVEVRRSILYPALASLISGGREQNVEYEQVSDWLDAFERAIDERFFDSLWASVDMEPDQASRQWQKILKEEAKRQYYEAERSSPIPSINRYRAKSQARSIFYGRMRSVLDLAIEDQFAPTK